MMTVYAVRRQANDPAVIERALGYRQRQLLVFAARYLERYGRSPSYRVIGEELDGASKADICRVIRRLERRGIVAREGKGREPRLVLIA